VHHLLNQTSDWSGTLWGVPDWADRPEGEDPARWRDRPLHAPGSRFKYNDVRVNLLAWALLQVHRRPLPEVLRKRIMDPIGASTTWRWHGYGNSWVELDGLRMQSVSGGGHFGGGLFISTEDHARYGLLFLRRGNWGGRQLFPADWVDRLRRPTPARPDYGSLVAEHRTGAYPRGAGDRSWSGCWEPWSDVRAQVRNRYSCMPLRRSMTRSTENSRRHLPRSSGV
jgi:CubicO group peptidase (beta-lactamase class C family)